MKSQAEGFLGDWGLEILDSARLSTVSAGVNSTWTVRGYGELRGENVGRGREVVGEGAEERDGKRGKGRRGGRKRKQGQAAAGANADQVSSCSEGSLPGSAGSHEGPLQLLVGDEHHHVPGSQAEKGGHEPRGGENTGHL